MIRIGNRSPDMFCVHALGGSGYAPGAALRRSLRIRLRGRAHASRAFALRAYARLMGSGYAPGAALRRSLRIRLRARRRFAPLVAHTPSRPAPLCAARCAYAFAPGAALRRSLRIRLRARRRFAPLVAHTPSRPRACVSGFRPSRIRAAFEPLRGKTTMHNCVDCMHRLLR